MEGKKNKDTFIIHRLFFSFLFQKISGKSSQCEVVLTSNNDNGRQNKLHIYGCLSRVKTGDEAYILYRAESIAMTGAAKSLSFFKSFLFVLFSEPFNSTMIICYHNNDHPVLMG